MATLFDEIELWLDPEVREGSLNMALDQAWLEWGQQPLLRVYGWNEPTVTIGYAQNLTKLAEALPAWPVVRRWTGGGVVFHERDHTYTLMVPAAHPWALTKPVESYRLIHAALAEALVVAGYAGCRLAEEADLKDLPFCFEAPALHDVIRGANKVAGAGQRRGKLGLLHQGSVQQVKLDDAFWRRWAGQLAGNVREIGEPAAGLMERAVELDSKRYRLPQWRDARDDDLGS
jgi:lipoate-protein ligase A